MISVKEINKPEIQMDKTYISNLLINNDKAVARALVALHNKQTASEQSSEATINRNGRGFTPADAFMGSNMAIYYLKFGCLSEKQISYWRKPNAKGIPRICKYSGQLLKISEEKAKNI